VVSTEEALVHERSAERGVIVEEPRDDAVDLLLVVAPSRFELDRDPFEDHPALRPLRRDLGQAAVAEERPQDRPLGRGDRSEHQPGLARRADLLRGPPQRVPLEPVGSAILAHPRHAGRRETVEVGADPFDREVERLGERPCARGPSSEDAGDRQALGVGERAQDLVGRLGHVGAPP